MQTEFIEPLTDYEAKAAFVALVETFDGLGCSPVATVASKEDEGVSFSLHFSVGRARKLIAARSLSMTGEIAAERARQIEAEGWTPEHDDEHGYGELALAASCYAAVAAQPANDHRHGPGYPPPQWPWSVDWWKPSNKRRSLVKAAALIVAEIERLDRIAAIQEQG